MLDGHRAESGRRAESSSKCTGIERPRVLRTAVLAASYLPSESNSGGDVDRAAGLLCQVIPALGSVHSTVVLQRVNSVRRALAAHAGRPSVQELEHLFRLRIERWLERCHHVFGEAPDVVRRSRLAGEADQERAVKAGADQQLGHHVGPGGRRHPTRLLLGGQVGADVLDPPSLNGTVDGADAVVSAIGAPRSKEPTTVYSIGVTNILDAMRRAGVQRFIGVSALPVTPRAEVSVLERLVVYPILYRFFGEGYADMARMEQLQRGRTISRADLAAAILRLLDDPHAVRTTVGVAY